MLFNFFVLKCTCFIVFKSSVASHFGDNDVLAEVLRRLDDKDKEIRTLLDHLSAQEDRIQDLEAQAEKKDQQLRRLEKTCLSRTSNSKRSLESRENENNVAFYAEMNNFTEHAQAHNDLMFDQVITNIGRAYDPNSGQFTAPFPGVFVFAVTLMSDPNHYNLYQIMKNGNQLLGNLLSHGSATTYDTSSQTVVVILNAGDRVTVQHLDPEGFAHGHAYSSFAGFLQQQDYSVPVLG